MNKTAAKVWTMQGFGPSQLVNVPPVQREMMATIELIEHIFGEAGCVALGIAYRERGEFRKAVKIALESLSKREEYVIQALYGIGVIETLTRAEIADALGLCRTAPYRILCQGLRKLRHPSRARSLLHFVYHDGGTPNQVDEYLDRVVQERWEKDRPAREKREREAAKREGERAARRHKARRKVRAKVRAKLIRRDRKRADEVGAGQARWEFVTRYFNGPKYVTKRAELRAKWSVIDGG